MVQIYKKMLIIHQGLYVKMVFIDETPFGDNLWVGGQHYLKRFIFSAYLFKNIYNFAITI